MLYEMATGVVPFGGTNSTEIIEAILHKDPIPAKNLNRTAPDGLERVVAKCLRKDRSLRYQRASEIRSDLEELKRKQELLSRVRRTRPGLLALGALICVVIATYLLMRRLPPPRVSGYVRISNDGQPKGIGRLGAIVADASRLYLAEGSVSAPTIASISTKAGETTPVGTPWGLPEIQGISSNRSELLVTDFAPHLAWPLWTLAIPKGTPHRIGNVLASAAAWSPDGREIAYIKERELCRAKSDGTGGAQDSDSLK